MWRIEVCHDPGRFFDLEKVCFENPWKLGSFETSELQVGWIIRNGGDAGYLWVQAIGDEFEILRIATHPKYRKLGLAKQLLQWFLKNHHGQVFLEVEHTNLAAIGLYGRCGFQNSGQRLNYYGPNRHAILMQMSTPPPT